MRIAPVIALLVLTFAAPSLRADEARPSPGQASPADNPSADKEHRTLESFATANPACLEWSDGCATCMRHDDTFSCSTPGIACQPTEPACRPAADPGAPQR